MFPAERPGISLGRRRKKSKWVKRPNFRLKKDAYRRPRFPPALPSPWKKIYFLQRK
jgi:hypothetical protein